MKWTIRRWHKWIAVAASTVLVMWAVSGISLFLPASDPSPRAPRPADWRSALVSPGQALVAAAAMLGDSASVPNIVQLRQLLGVPVYYLGFPGGRTVFVDASSGDAFRMDSALASRVAEEARGAPPRSVVRLDRHGPTYAYGDLPVFVVEFEGGGPRAYVSGNSGGVVLSTLTGRLRQGLAALHDGRIVEVVVGLRPAYLFIVGFGVLTLVAALTGLWLALPARLRRRLRTSAPQ